MPLQQRDLLRVCEILAEQEGLKVTVNESFKGACFAFAGAFLGGLFGGPVGIPIGAALGGGAAGYRSRGKFKSAVYIIAYEMSENDRLKLVEAVRKSVKNIKAEDVITLIAMINANTLLKKLILDSIKNCLVENMGYSLTK